MTHGHEVRVGGVLVGRCRVEEGREREERKNRTTVIS